MQVKSREGQPKGDVGEARWLIKKALEGARQASGTVRTLGRGPADLVNGRGRSITCHGDQLTWIGVVILDHPTPPEDIDPPTFDFGVLVVAMLRRDWDFLFDHLRSVSAVVDYLHRIVDEPPVPFGEEPARYFELAHADEHAPTQPAAPWIEQVGAQQTARPILPKAPASAADAGSHAIFRVVLEDIAESAFTGEEEHRLEMLAKLDRFSVGDRAELGRLLMQHLDAARTVDADTTSWRHRLVVQDSTAPARIHRAHHRRVRQRRAALDRRRPSHTALRRLPRVGHHAHRHQDDASLDADERARLSAIWNEARIR